MVIRASGPALNANFSLNGIVSDPVIELYDQATGQIVATNDDWDPVQASHFNVVGAFPWMSGSRDSALVTSLNPGGYTVIVRGKNGGTGLALVEVYGEN